MSLDFDHDHLKGFLAQKDFKGILPKIKQAHLALHQRSGKGKEFLGWLDLPGRIEEKSLQEINDLAEEVRNDSEALICIGTGGSYLGARATIECLGADKLPVFYAGHNISSDELYHLLKSLKDKRTSVAFISKSGTTTEPALAFRVVKKWMQGKYKDHELRKRIICVTAAKTGALLKIVQKEGYRTFVIPEDVGGRFSVLTPGGLVPLAVAGVDIKSLVQGACQGQTEYASPDLENNSAYQYAASRYLLYKKGKVIEVLSSFYPNMFFMGEWWKQIFAESEGKEGRGIFPATLKMSDDLHAMGQWMQEGVRNVFETFLKVDKVNHEIVIPHLEQDLDGFNCVAGKDLEFVNKKAYEATAQAHYEGNVPNMTITLCQADSFHLGHLFYFFEKAVAISGYLLGINPFDQPGVEAYKNKMFKLLGKK